MNPKYVLRTALIIAVTLAAAACASGRAAAWNNVNCPPGYQKMPSRAPGGVGVCQG